MLALTMLGILQEKAKMTRPLRKVATKHALKSQFRSINNFFKHLKNSPTPDPQIICVKIGDIFHCK